MVNDLRESLSKICSAVTLTLYVIIAILLVAGAVAATIDSVILIVNALSKISVTGSYYFITEALQSVLLIIVVVSLIDMVRSYIKYGRILVHPILIAGITTMVRRLLVTDSEFTEMIGIAVVIFVLAMALFFLGRQDLTITEKLKKQKESLAEAEISTDSKD